MLNVAAAALLTAAAWYALRTADPRHLLAAGAAGVVALASAASGHIPLSGWALALLGGLGLLLYVENAVLLARLDHVRQADGALDAESEERLARELRRAETRPILLTAALLTASLLAAPALFLLADPGLSASIEARSGYGLLLGALAVSGLLLAWRKARGEPR